MRRQFVEAPFLIARADLWPRQNEPELLTALSLDDG